MYFLCIQTPWQICQVHPLKRAGSRWTRCWRQPSTLMMTARMRVTGTESEEARTLSPLSRSFDLFHCHSLAIIMNVFRLLCSFELDRYLYLYLLLETGMAALCAASGSRWWHWAMFRHRKNKCLHCIVLHSILFRALFSSADGLIVTRQDVTPMQSLVATILSGKIRK